MKISLCPIDVTRSEVVSQWGNRKQLQFKYLLVKDLAALRGLVGEQTPAEFFRDLESTHVSQLIDEIRINVRVKKNEAPITFAELSEGERQLLTVLGLMRFTAGEESLFLLDEPDTHLNPRWSVDYLRYIDDFIPFRFSTFRNHHWVLGTGRLLIIRRTALRFTGLRQSLIVRRLR